MNLVNTEKFTDVPKSFLFCVHVVCFSVGFLIDNCMFMYEIYVVDSNLMHGDADSKPVTYVQLMLLSDRSSYSKCKTHASKDNSSPTFDET